MPRARKISSGSAGGAASLSVWARPLITWRTAASSENTQKSPAANPAVMCRAASTGSMPYSRFAAFNTVKMRSASALPVGAAHCASTPALYRDFPKETAALEPGVIDQQVGVAEALEDIVRQCLDGSRVGHVDAACFSTCTARVQLGRQRSSAAGVDVGDHDAHVQRCQIAHKTFANASGATGDYRGATAESSLRHVRGRHLRGRLLHGRSVVELKKKMERERKSCQHKAAASLNP